MKLCHHKNNTKHGDGTLQVTVYIYIQENHHNSSGVYAIRTNIINNNLNDSFVNIFAHLYKHFYLHCIYNKIRLNLQIAVFIW